MPCFALTVETTFSTGTLVDGVGTGGEMDDDPRKCGGTLLRATSVFGTYAVSSIVACGFRAVFATRGSCVFAGTVCFGTSSGLGTSFVIVATSKTSKPALPGVRIGTFFASGAGSALPTSSPEPFGSVFDWPASPSVVGGAAAIALEESLFSSLRPTGAFSDMTTRSWGDFGSVWKVVESFMSEVDCASVLLGTAPSASVTIFCSSDFKPGSMDPTSKVEVESEAKPSNF